MANNYTLIFNRKTWDRFISEGVYTFTNEQLDKAENDKRGYIGTYQSKHSVKGVDCFIQKSFG